jgi:hypothetical protein
MATVRRSRNLIVLAVSSAVLASAAPALAAARPAHHRRALGGCGAAPAGSAIHEYCEAIPTATGGSVPRVGSPSVAKTLPTPIVRALNAGPVAERKLLTLPAHKRHKRAKVRTASLNDPSSGWSLSLLIILILVAIALALAGGAAERWRRSRA